MPRMYHRIVIGLNVLVDARTPLALALVLRLQELAHLVRILLAIDDERPLQHIGRALW